VFTTAGSARKCAACLGLGAELNYRDGDFVEMMKAAERRREPILDGRRRLPAPATSGCVVADDGRLVQIAFLQGPKS
jgi:NADPH:quinone reductase-like Zn-dependent oxidoreductase